MPMDSTTQGERRLLEVNHLHKYFPVRKGLLRRVVDQIRAVDDVSFFIRQGETLGLVGESGCGKTTTARTILRAITPTSGEVLFHTAAGEVVDLATLSKAQLRPLRREMQMIFQDPFASLNPRMNVLEIVGEPLLVNGMRQRKQRTERVAELLRLVGLRPEYMQRFPHAFSGGERQRIGIARALALEPQLLVADEPVSALDVSVQAQVINLLLDLQAQLGLTYLFVAHDLNIVRHFTDRVAIMYAGRIVELARTEELFAAPRHPYTAALLAAIPIPDPRARSYPSSVAPDSPGASRAAHGCAYHLQCPFAIDRCREETPELIELTPGHSARCHRANELELSGLSRSIDLALR